MGESYQHDRWMQACRTKLRFLTQEEAKAVILHKKNIWGNTALKTYKCKFCEGYHLATKKRGKGMKKEKQHIHPNIFEIENEKELSNVTDLRLITGGKEPPSTSSNWLSDLEKGTLFLIQDKQNPMEFNLGSFMVREKTDKAVVLTTATVPHPLYVNPVRFCNKYSLYEVLCIFKDEGEEAADAETPSDESICIPKDIA